MGWAEDSPNPETFFMKEQIAQYHKINADFNCILFDFPDPSAGGYRAGFCEKVSGMIAATGTVIPLSSGRPLILLPLAKDRELIAHRLSQSLGARTLLSFEAHGPEEVISSVNSLT
jgi:hypothetical protein